MDTRSAMREIDACASEIESCYLLIAKAYGLTYNELMLLYTVDEVEGLTQKQASDALLLTRSSVHTVLGSLMKKGLLTLVNGRNLKEKAITFTPAGKEQMAEIERLTEAIEDDALQAVSPSEQELVLRVVKTVAERMSAVTRQALVGCLAAEGDAR